VDEDPVVAVRVRCAERLVGHGQDALALLAGRLRDELLDPEPEARDRVLDREGQLVAPVQRELAHGRPEPDARVLRVVGLLADLLGHLRALEQRGHVHAHQRRRHEPEV
jgi:hypothetical protein